MMALTKADLGKINDLVKINILAAVREAVKEIAKEMSAGKNAVNYRDKTIKKLEAYNILKHNLEKCERDMDDLYKEEFGTCPAVHHAMEYYGEKCTVDEIRYVKKLKIEHDYYRDKEEVDFIDSILNEIKDDYYGEIIKMIYFDKVRIEDIAAKMKCDKVTLYRNRNRLLDILSIRFFGKDAIG
jgi:hypothetical protein|nr:MAG TPA: Protein of unknown function (DUF1492) [Caudoviricetes sp.]